MVAESLGVIGHLCTPSRRPYCQHKTKACYNSPAMTSYLCGRRATVLVNSLHTIMGDEHQSGIIDFPKGKRLDSLKYSRKNDSSRWASWRYETTKRNVC